MFPKCRECGRRNAHYSVCSKYVVKVHSLVMVRCPECLRQGFRFRSDDWTCPECGAAMKLILDERNLPTPWNTHKQRKRRLEVRPAPERGVKAEEKRQAGSTQLQETQPERDQGQKEYIPEDQQDEVHVIAAAKTDSPEQGP